MHYRCTTAAALQACWGSIGQLKLSCDGMTLSWNGDGAGWHLATD